MPIKQGLLPRWHIVIRDLKRGITKVRIKEEEYHCTLQNAFINEKHHKESNPNNPLEKDIINAWDVNRLRWVQFKISELEEYHPPFLGVERDETDKERIETPGYDGRVGYRETKGVQGTQETQTDDRGTEGQGEGESGEGKGGKRSSKE